MGFVGLLKFSNFLKFLKEYVVKLVMMRKVEIGSDGGINCVGVWENGLVLSNLSDGNCKKIFLLVVEKWKVFEFRCFFLNGFE